MYIVAYVTEKLRQKRLTFQSAWRNVFLFVSFFILFFFFTN